MQQIKLLQPDYSEGFRCIGPACEDHCCEDWNVHVDQASFEKYQNLPAGPLRTLIDANVLRLPQKAQAGGGSAAELFAQIQMNESRKCPLLSAGGLCRIQEEHGHDYLPHACATYPRVPYSIGGVKETALSLSCPEAARLVLLNPQLLKDAGQDGGLRIESDRTQENDPLLQWFWPVRNFAIALLQNSVYPLWQRLFLLSLVSRRFDAIAPEERPVAVPQLLADFEAAAVSGNLQASMNSLPVESAQQLDVVLLLAGMLLRESSLRPRFLECVQAFTQGIGNGPGATLESLAASYATAHDRYYEPFFRKHSYILENYLINTMFRSRFPFGRDWAQTGATPSATRESTLLIAQFALMKGLLIGVAGFYGEKFSTAHVVHTMQAASKHFEHHGQFLTRAHNLLVEKRMDGLMGAAVLLRNEKSRASSADLPVFHAPGQLRETAVAPTRLLPPN